MKKLIPLAGLALVALLFGGSAHAGVWSDYTPYTVGSASSSTAYFTISEEGQTVFREPTYFMDSTASFYDAENQLLLKIWEGRIDQYKYVADGALIALGYRPDTPVNNTRAGHYAFTSLDSTKKQHTIGILESWITDITSTSLDSSISLRYMDSVNGYPGGTYSYQQPNKEVKISSAGLSLPNIPIKTSSGALGLMPANGKVGVGTTAPGTTLHATAGANATTTVTVGELNLSSSKGCVNMNRTNGAPASFYINSAGIMVVETNYCR